jgi:DNA-binding NtrC family response regulator
VRIIAATHHDLERDIRENRFRADLFHRLNQAVIALPPLRERKDDIPALVKFFLERSAAERHLPISVIDDEAIDALQNRPWPGNVRDLENAVRKAMALAGGYAITKQTIHNALGKIDAPHQEQGQTLAMLVSELLARAEAGQVENAAVAFTWDTEHELYEQAIKRAKGNQVKAAKWLGVSRTTMREKLRLFGLHSIGSGSA